jgi:N-acetylneuraminate synthase/N,N'-diacetyllegionaminate synthase
MKIGNFNLDEKVFIIAEIGNNHEGDFSLAEKMIGLAAESGADAVKFQTIVPEKLVTSTYVDRIIQLKKLQFSYKQFEELKKIADEKNIIFLSTPFDIESAEYLNDLIPAFKIASGDNNFFPLIEYIASTGKPIILSAGLTDINMIRTTRDFIWSQWKKHNHDISQLAILHCNVAYPTPVSDVNLLAIKELQSLNVTAGFSDHTIGIDAAVLSVALGARIIEKHFTIDKNYSNFHDHKLSADPDEMKLLVEKSKEVIKILGSGKKIISESEKENEAKARRSIAVKRDLNEGCILSMEDITWLRPGDGIAPGMEEKVLGKRIKKNLKTGELIFLTDLE